MAALHLNKLQHHFHGLPDENARHCETLASPLRTRRHGNEAAAISVARDSDIARARARVSAGSGQQMCRGTDKRRN